MPRHILSRSLAVADPGECCCRCWRLSDLLVLWWLVLAEGGVVYRTFKDVAADIRLVWYNALRYNPAGNPVHRLAEDFQRKFEEEYKRVEEE